jgi:hypothetical protein
MISTARIRFAAVVHREIEIVKEIPRLHRVLALA